MPLVTDSLRRATRHFGAREAISCGPTRLTYLEFKAECERMAGRLQAHGVRPGSRVATLMLNCHRHLMTYFAVPGMGAVLVPLNTRHAVPEHRYILADADVDVLLVDREHAAISEELADLVTVIIAEEGDGYPNSMPISHAAREDDVAAFFYTGGTTGRSKGVMLTHRNLTSNALHLALALGYESDDCYLHIAPMFHLGDGMSTYAITWLGGRHAFVPRFDTASVLREISKSRVTSAMVVPTMLNSLVHDPWPEEADLSSLRLLIHGGAPIATSVLRAAVEKLECSFTQAYGMTEAAPLLTALAHEEELIDDERLKSAGRAIVGVEVTTRRPDGTHCDVDEIGEVVASGPNIMVGYWNKPEATAAVLRDGEYWTGDLGFLDRDGYLFLAGRVKDMIISGGENIYASEVEEALAGHPHVREVAVIGVPDDRWGERVHGVIVTGDGDPVDIEGLRTFCKERIANYKVPRSWEFRQEMPLSGAGKILKHELRATHWQSHDRAIH